MTKDTDSLVPEIKLFLQKDDRRSIVVGSVYLDTEEHQIRVRLMGGEYYPRELHSLTNQAFVACERLLEGR
jgi:hypothetical protein